MASLGDLLVKVGADVTEFQTAMTGVSGDINRVAKDLDKSTVGFDKFAAAFTTIGTELTAAFTLPLVGAGLAVTAFAGDFDSSMRKVTSLLDGTTDQAFAKLSGDVLKLSSDMGVDAVKSSEALYQALSADVPQENAIDFLRVATTAAIAGVADTKTAVDLLTTVMAAFGLGMEHTREVADAAFAAVKIGKMEFSDFSAAVGIAAGTANLLGIKFQELAAASATITLTGGKTVSEAMTELRSAMVALIEPSAQMEVLLGRLGFTSGIALVQSKGLEGALQALFVAAEGDTAAFEKAFGRIDGFNGAVSLTGPHAQLASEHLTQLGHASDGVGAAQLAADEINKGFARTMEMLLVPLKNVAIQFGTALLPTVRDLANDIAPLIGHLSSMATWFGSLPDPVKETAFGLAAVLAAVGPLTLGVGLLSTAVIKGYEAFMLLTKVLILSDGAVAALGGATTAIKLFAVQGIPAAITALTTFATVSVPAAISALTTFAVGLIPEASASIGVFATSALPAAITALKTFAVEGIPAAIAAVMEFAAVSIPAAITGLVTLATTTIPAAITSFLALASTGIASAATAMLSFALDALPAVTTAFLALAPAIVLAAGALGGFALGRWAEDNIPAVHKLTSAFVDMLLTLPGAQYQFDKMTGVLSANKQATESAEFVTKQYEDRLKSIGITIDKTGLTAEQYNQKLKDAVTANNDAIQAVKNHGTQLDATGKSATAAATSTDTMSAAAKKLVDEQRKATTELAAAQKAYDEVATAVANGQAPHEALTRAQIALTAAQTAAHPVIAKVKDTQDALKTSTEILESTLKTYESQVTAAKKAHEAGLAPLQDVKDAEQRVTDVLVALHPEWKKNADAMAAAATVITAMPPELKKVQTGLEDLPLLETSQGFNDITLSLSGQFDAALKQVGLKSVPDLTKALNSAEDAYGTIVTAGGNFEQQLVAQIGVLQAQADMWAAEHNGSIPASMQIGLATANQLEADFVYASKTRWSTLTGQIRGGFNDMFGALNHAVIDGDWNSLVDTITGDLKQMGEDVLTTFVKPFEDAASRFLTGALTDLLTGTNNLSTLWSQLGKDITGVFNKVPITTPGINGQMPNVGQIPSTTPTAPNVPGASGGAGGAAGVAGSTLGMVTGIVGAVGSVAGAVFGAFDNAQNNNIKQTLNFMRNDVSWMSQKVGMPGGIFDTSADTAHKVSLFLDGFNTWFSERLSNIEFDGHSALEHLGNIRNALLPDIRYYLEHLETASGVFSEGLVTLGDRAIAGLQTLGSAVGGTVTASIHELQIAMESGATRGASLIASTVDGGFARVIDAAHTAQPPIFNVRVFVGTREITDIVDVRVDQLFSNQGL